MLSNQIVQCHIKVYNNVFVLIPTLTFYWARGKNINFSKNGIAPFVERKEVPYAITKNEKSSTRSGSIYIRKTYFQKLYIKLGCYAAGYGSKILKP